jgi:cell division protein ZapA
MKQKTTPITINILDKEYRIACPEEEQDNLLQTSTLLNQKMRDTQARGHIFGSERIAVMTALNITHEHLQNRQQQQTTTQVIDRLLKRQATQPVNIKTINEKIQSLENQINQVLKNIS